MEEVAAGVSVFFLAGAVGASVGGRLADRFGAQRALRGCLLVTAASLVGAALFAQSLLALVLFLAVAGLANSVGQPATNLFVSDEIPDARQGLGFGIKQSGIPAAILVSGLALPLLAIPLGWRATFAICALGPVAVALLLRGRPSTPVARRAGRPSRTLLLATLAAALGSGSASGLGAYLVASAVDVGIDEAAAGVLAAAASALCLVARVSAGARADRRRAYGVEFVALMLLFGSLGFALMATGGVAPFVVGALVAFALGWGWPGLFNLSVVANNRETPGAASGVSQTGVYIGAGLGPVLFGAILSEGGYDAAWLASAGCAVVAASVMWLAARSARV